MESYSKFGHKFQALEVGISYQTIACWCRLTVKQTYNSLKLKRTFTPHVSGPPFSTSG